MKKAITTMLAALCLVGTSVTVGGIMITDNAQAGVVMGDNR